MKRIKQYLNPIILLKKSDREEEKREKEEKTREGKKEAVLTIANLLGIEKKADESKVLLRK